MEPNFIRWQRYSTLLLGQLSNASRSHKQEISAKKVIFITGTAYDAKVLVALGALWPLPEGGIQCPSLGFLSPKRFRYKSRIQSAVGAFHRSCRVLA